LRLPAESTATCLFTTPPLKLPFGPLAAIGAPAVQFGAKIELGGRLTSALEWNTSSAFYDFLVSVGAEYDGTTGQWTNLSTADSVGQIVPDVVYLQEKTVRGEAWVGFSALVRFGVDTLLFGFFDVIEGTAGVKADLGVALMSDQIDDPAYASGYKLAWRVAVGPGADSKTALSYFKIPTGLVSHQFPEHPIARSPIGTLTASPTTVRAGESVTFTVKLDPMYTKLFGSDNVQAVDLYTGTGEVRLASLAPGADGVATWAWRPRTTDVGSHAVSAFVVTRVLKSFGPYQVAPDGVVTINVQPFPDGGSPMDASTPDTGSMDSGSGTDGTPRDPGDEPAKACLSAKDCAGNQICVALPFARVCCEDKGNADGVAQPPPFICPRGYTIATAISDTPSNDYAGRHWYCYCGPSDCGYEIQMPTQRACTPPPPPMMTEPTP